MAGFFVKDGLQLTFADIMEGITLVDINSYQTYLNAVLVEIKKHYNSATPAQKSKIKELLPGLYDVIDEVQKKEKSLFKTIEYVENFGGYLMGGAAKVERLANALYMGQSPDYEKLILTIPNAYVDYLKELGIELPPKKRSEVTPEHAVYANVVAHGLGTMITDGHAEPSAPPRFVAAPINEGKSIT